MGTKSRKVAYKGGRQKEESLLTRTVRTLRRFNLQARKGLGQHFLIDERVLDLITEAAELTTSDVVVEVGPGLGVLTRDLARQSGRVITVELDDKLAAILKKSLAPLGNVTVINEDILRVDSVGLLRGEEVGSSPIDISTYKVVANLPYYITAPVLRHFLETSFKPRNMVVMVQKEVADTIIAGPGRMSVLGISVQFYGEPEIVSYVPARCFYPAPEVDSAILKIRLYPQSPLEATDEKRFFKLVRAGFTAPRKQLGNSLTQGLEWSRASVLYLLKEADIQPQRRAETLTLDEWIKLWKIFIRVR